MHANATTSGLEVWGSVEYDPGQPYPTASCGGVPPSWDIEVEGIALEDADEFLATGVIDDLARARDWTQVTTRIVEAVIRITGTLPDRIAQHVLARWDDDLQEALRSEHPSCWP